MFPIIRDVQVNRQGAIMFALACGHRKIAAACERAASVGDAVICRACVKAARRRGERVLVGTGEDGATVLLACGHAVPVPYEDEVRRTGRVVRIVCTRCEPGADWDEPRRADGSRPEVAERYLRERARKLAARSGKASGKADGALHETGGLSNVENVSAQTGKTAKSEIADDSTGEGVFQLHLKAGPSARNVSEVGMSRTRRM